MEPDFNLRNLEDYTEKDLDILMDAVIIRYNQVTHNETRQALDVWGYRIKDAIAIARKREAETHPPKDDDSLLSSFKGIFK